MGKNEFYLGGTLVIERAVNRIYDISTWSMGSNVLPLYWCGLKRAFGCLYTSGYQKRQRISFSIRPQVTKFFEVKVYQLACQKQCN